jgi:hypothetical protein
MISALPPAMAAAFGVVHEVSEPPYVASPRADSNLAGFSRFDNYAREVIALENARAERLYGRLADYVEVARALKGRSE